MSNSYLLPRVFRIAGLALTLDSDTQCRPVRAIALDKIIACTFK